jgi:hypothetical protein
LITRKSGKATALHAFYSGAAAGMLRSYYFDNIFFEIN